ncbi:MAG: RNA polymerase sigma factor [Vicinamibacterales bacterium]
MAVGSLPVAPEGRTLFERHVAEIEQVIRLVSSRSHLTSAEAEDFSSDVMVRLLEDDCAVLRRFEGRSSLRTFLTVVIQRQLLDFRARSWGKWRPSAEARRHGEVGILLERLLTRDGHTFEEACEVLASRHDVSIPRAEIETIAGSLPARTRRRFEGDDQLEQVAVDALSPDEHAMTRDRRDTIQRVRQALATHTAQLPPQDRLILAMRFEDGVQVARIADTLKLDARQTYRRIEQRLRDLRRLLAADGFEAASVLEALAVEGMHDGDADAAEFAIRRPSMVKGASEWR